MELKGQVNVYSHKTSERVPTSVTCDLSFVGTINMNSGTTPFVIGCDLCREPLFSRFYCTPKRVRVTKAFYRPCYNEYLELGADVQEHVLMGGLILGDFGSVKPINDDPWKEQVESLDADDWLKYIAASYKPPSDVWERILKRLGK